MKSWISTITIAVFTAVPAIACMEFAERFFTGEDHDLLALYLDENVDELSGSSPIRSIWSSGYGESYFVEVQFEPHNESDGIQSYYFLVCQFDPESGFECDSPETRYSISFFGPADFVQVDKGFSAQVGRSIVSSIRKSILIDTEGRYRYQERDEEKTSDKILDLLRIKSVGEGMYRVYANSDTSCSSHVIEVREIECGLDVCSFEVLKNEVVYSV